MSDRIALLGATGPIGQSVAAALRAEGRPYRVVGRSMDSLRSLYGADPLAEAVRWDTDSLPSMEAALRGVDTVVYLIGVNYWQFEQHPVLMRKTLDAAIAAGVKNFVLIGTVYPYGRVQGSNPIREDHPREPHTFKGHMRKEQEDLLMQAHAEGKINATVLRLPDFYGPGVSNSMLHSVFQAAANDTVANMLAPLDRPHEFVFVPDVGPVVLRLAEQPGAYGHFWHLAGSAVTTQAQLLRELERIAGHPIRHRAAGKTMLRVAGLFSPIMRELVEMHYLFTEPVIMDDTALAQLIGPIQKTSYAQGLRLCVEAEERAKKPAERVAA